MKTFTSKTQKVGEKGEDIAVSFLKNKGFSIKERNYTKPWGEIDVIAESRGKVYFCEVKAVSCKTIPKNRSDLNRVYNPGENITEEKLKKMFRTAQSYLIENSMLENDNWSLNALIVFIDMEGKKSAVDFIENIL